MKTEGKGLFHRLFILAGLCFGAVGIFYSSLLFTASPLAPENAEKVRAAISVIEKRGFINEAYLLRDLATFRGSDNWLNATVAKENAYAATNYPFAIITLYPDFFTYPEDDTERAAILLHEARHLKGDNEEEAYEFVWRNKKFLNWTEKNYGDSVVWLNIRTQTTEYTPNLFVCNLNPMYDCTYEPRVLEK